MQSLLAVYPQECEKCVNRAPVYAFGLKKHTINYHLHFVLSRSSCKPETRLYRLLCQYLGIWRIMRGAFTCFTLFLRIRHYRREGAVWWMTGRHACTEYGYFNHPKRVFRYQSRLIAPSKLCVIGRDCVSVSIKRSTFAAATFYIQGVCHACEHWFTCLNRKFHSTFDFMSWHVNCVKSNLDDGLPKNIDNYGNVMSVQLRLHPFLVQ